MYKTLTAIISFDCLDDPVKLARKYHFSHFPGKETEAPHDFMPYLRTMC